MSVAQMNANDRIALEIGRAHLTRVIAEARAEQLVEQVEDLTKQLTHAQGEPAGLKDELLGDVEETGGSEPGSDHGGSSETATG